MVGDSDLPVTGRIDLDASKEVSTALDRTDRQPPQGWSREASRNVDSTRLFARQSVRNGSLARGGGRCAVLPDGDRGQRQHSQPACGRVEGDVGDPPVASRVAPPSMERNERISRRPSALKGKSTAPSDRDDGPDDATQSPAAMGRNSPSRARRRMTCEEAAACEVSSHTT